MNTKTFFTSDTHFSHANIIRYCSRPFKDTEEMHREMIMRWNVTVGPRDTVYHLGDFAMGPKVRYKEIHDALNGKKILVRGNHDRNARWMIEHGGWQEVYEKLEWDGWLLQHIPFDTPRKLLCGHVHTNWTRIGWTINVGVDKWDFTPRTIEELVQAKSDGKWREPDPSL